MRRRAITSLVMTALISATAQAAEPTLSPQAAKAFKQGLSAAKQERWEDAVRAFTGAQRASWNAPPILYNLGLAHAKAGHLLLAIAWFEAYLATVPDAPNAAAVRTQMPPLLNAAQTSIDPLVQHILQEALAAAQQVSEPDARARALAHVSEAFAACGHVEAALEARKPAMQTWWGPQYEAHLPDAQSLLWSAYASALAAAGDLEQAQQLLTNHVTKIRDQENIWFAISQYEFRMRHDLAGARQAATHLHDVERFRSYLHELEQAEQRSQESANLQRATALLSGAPSANVPTATVASAQTLQASDLILLAQEMSDELRLTNPVQALERIAQQGGAGELMVASIANVAQTLAWHLLRLRVMAQQLGLNTQVAASP